MNVLDPRLASHEIDRRVRAADHRRRVRRARHGRYAGAPASAAAPTARRAG